MKPEICSERTNLPSAGQADSYLVSTFRLEPEHFQHHPARTEVLAGCLCADKICPHHTHDWHVQPYCQRPKPPIRLSGAPSVHTDPLSQTAIRMSSKPFKRIACAARLSTLCNHRISTCFQQGRELQSMLWITLKDKQRDACFRLKRLDLSGAGRSGRRLHHQRSLGGSAFRGNPSGTLSPNANPGIRG